MRAVVWDDVFSPISFGAFTPTRLPLPFVLLFLLALSLAIISHLSRLRRLLWSLFLCVFLAQKERETAGRGDCTDLHIEERQPPLENERTVSAIKCAFV